MNFLAVGWVEIMFAPFVARDHPTRLSISFFLRTTVQSAFLVVLTFWSGNGRSAQWRCYMCLLLFLLLPIVGLQVHRGNCRRPACMHVSQLCAGCWDAHQEHCLRERATTERGEKMYMSGASCFSSSRHSTVIVLLCLSALWCLSFLLPGFWGGYQKSQQSGRQSTGLCHRWDVLSWWKMFRGCFHLFCSWSWRKLAMFNVRFFIIFPIRWWK